MLCFDQDTHIYIWVDTSGTVNEPAVAAAVATLKARLQAEVYGDVDVDTRVFYDSSWTDERWVTKLTQTTQAASNAIALVFINESAPVYHANSGPSPEPTGQYLTDHAAFLSAVAGAERFQALLYAITIESPGYLLFKQHIGRALNGTDGYPAGLGAYGVEARFDVDPTQEANAYYRDLLGWLTTLCDGAPPVDAPVTLHMSESLSGVFADPTVDVTFFSVVDLPIGASYSIGDQLSGRTWYSGTVRDKSVQGGLATYSLETLLATLGRVRPREALILVAGENGVPNPLTLRECLIRFLDYYGVPYDPDIPEFYLRAGEEIVVPTVPAFVIQPDQQSPLSIYEQLEPFYGVFRSYAFRADTHNRLVVTPPAWIDTIGVRLHLWRRRQEGNDRYPTRQSAGAPWSTERRPLVEWTATVDGVTHAGELPAPLELGEPLQTIIIGPVTVRIQWRASDNRVQASVWPPPPSDLTIGSLYAITFTLRPETAPDEDEVLELTVSDLDPDEVQTSSADTVVNQVVIPVRPRTFQPSQQIMQAAALVLASPGGLMPGLFGNTPFGPMDEELETPNGFLELVNDTVQEGTWFWPADENVVIQPGGNITVAYEVEEWAEQWRSPSAPHEAASQVNSFSDTVDLPANGAEVRLFDFQFPRQTTNAAPSPYGARGTVFGRWRAGENPGIELRVGNSHFVEFGYLAELLGVFGQTVYFLWGAIVKLNGTGTTFTIGDVHTYRFGFSRAADGLWEGGANVPGLSESQALYPNRTYTAPELPYETDEETALAMARGIVEENLTPKVVYTLTVAASRLEGYAAGPWHVGRAVRIPALGISGRLTAIEYGEAHTAQAQGDTSHVTVEIEANAAPAGSRAAARTYKRAAYGISHYQQEA